MNPDRVSWPREMADDAERTARAQQDAEIARLRQSLARLEAENRRLREALRDAGLWRPGLCARLERPT